MGRRRLPYRVIGIAAGIGVLFALLLMGRWKCRETPAGYAAETEDYGKEGEKVSITGKREKTTEKAAEKAEGKEEPGQTDMGQSETPGGNSSYSQEEKEEFDSALEEYRETVHPAILENEDYAKAVFIGDHQEKFDKAIADYIFYLYGDIEIDKVELVEFVEESDEELTYQVRVHSGEESEPFLCTYNKEYDFYSLYTYNDVRG